jgi:dTDP-4-dehydrorhamnose reductase
VRGTLAALDAWVAATPARRAALAGTHHLVSSGHTTWHGFAEAIVAEAMARGLLPRAPRVSAIRTRDFPTPARRPAWSVLDNGGFVERFDLPLPDWREELPAVLTRLADPVS